MGSQAIGAFSPTFNPSIFEVAEEYQDQGEYHAESPLGAEALAPATTEMSLTHYASTSTALFGKSGKRSLRLVVPCGGSESISCCEGSGVSLATGGIVSSSVELCGGSIRSGEEEEASFVITGVDN